MLVTHRHRLAVACFARLPSTRTARRSRRSARSSRAADHTWPAQTSMSGSPRIGGSALPRGRSDTRNARTSRAFRIRRPRDQTTDATDNRLFATQYYGCWVVELYHRSRTHLGLAKDAPDHRPVSEISTGPILAIREVGGFTTGTSGAQRKRPLWGAQITVHAASVYSRSNPPRRSRRRTRTSDFGTAVHNGRIGPGGTRPNAR